MKQNELYEILELHKLGFEKLASATTMEPYEGSSIHRTKGEERPAFIRVNGKKWELSEWGLSLLARILRANSSQHYDGMI